VAFISKARCDAADERDLEGAPELVIEILSPSNTKPRLREYAALCLANGCEEFWAIDRKHKKVTVTDRNGQSIEYSSGMNVPLTVLSGTSVAVDRIFS
jgi:Uma2 family endonuclease